MVIDYTACYTKGTKINGASLPGYTEKHRELALHKKIHLSCLQHKKREGNIYCAACHMVV